MAGRRGSGTGRRLRCEEALLCTASGERHRERGPDAGGAGGARALRGALTPLGAHHVPAPAAHQSDSDSAPAVAPGSGRFRSDTLTRIRLSAGGSGRGSRRLRYGLMRVAGSRARCRAPRAPTIDHRHGRQLLVLRPGKGNATGLFVLIFLVDTTSKRTNPRRDRERSRQPRKRSRRLRTWPLLLLSKRTEMETAEPANGASETDVRGRPNPRQRPERYAIYAIEQEGCTLNTLNFSIS